MTQKLFLKKILQENPEAIIVGSIGSISTDLSTIEHKNKVLLRGAMGAAMGVGLGIAMNTDKQVIVLIGDGSFLMKMGSMSTILRHSLPNLRIIILNNNCYKSCGGQSTNFKYLKNVPFEIIEITPDTSTDKPDALLCGGNQGQQEV